MHIQKFLFLLLVILVLTGCNSNQEINELKTQIISLDKKIEQDKLEYDEVNSELLKIKSEKSKLEKDLEITETEITRLESKITENEESYSQLELEVLGASDNSLWYIIKEVDNYYQTITIIGYDVDGINEDFSEITINGNGQGELFKAKVLGSIFDFELVEVEWNSSKNELQEVRVLKKLGEVRNQDIIINTTLPEGIPGEKIKWRDMEGNEYEYVLGYDGYGFNGTIIWNK